MMKIIEHAPRQLTLWDSAGCLWLLGFFFITICGIIVAGPSGLFYNLHEASELEKFGAWVVSLSGLAAGFWLIYNHPGVYARFDKRTNSLSVNRKGLLKNTTETYRLSNITDVVLNETTDSEGDPFYRIALIINPNKQVLLFSTGLYNKETQQKNVDLIKNFLQNNY